MHCRKKAGADIPSAVFEAESITAITFYARYGSGDVQAVPEACEDCNDNGWIKEESADKAKNSPCRFGRGDFYKFNRTSATAPKARPTHC